MVDITALGELLVDFTQHGRSETGMRLYEQNPGGAVTNLLAAAARCGASTAFLGKVGDDIHGRFLKRALAEAGVNVDGLVMAADVFTTLAFVTLSETGEREFSFARKPGADTCLQAEELDWGRMAHTRVFHTGSLSLTDEPARTATYRAVSAAKAAGAVITYDPNYRAGLWRGEAEAAAAMRSLIPTADIMKLSDAETLLLTGEAAPSRAAAALYRQGVPVVAVTLGSQGALVLAQGETRLVPGYAAKAVDTTGAGDCFFGGFLYKFLQMGCPPQALTLEQAAQCADFGNAAASLCVEGRGGIPAMPALGQITARQRS